MRKITSILAMMGALLLPLLFASPASAQATRTWISGVGDDINPCSRTAPCKTFPAAIALTAAGGEIDMLDPGGFGAVTVTKAITIAQEGTGEAGILVAGTNGITVNCISDPNCTVIVRGLTIDGGPIGSNSSAGIKFIAGKSLMVQNTTIRNFTGFAPNGYGIWFAPSASASLFVNNCTIVSNGQPGGLGGGIFIQPAGGTTTAAIRNSQVSNNNGFGVRGDTTLGGAIDLTVSDSETSGNGGAGVAMISALSGGVAGLAVIDHTTIGSNVVGLNGNGAAVTVRVGTTTIMRNATGIKQVNSATMTSYGTNQITGNAIPGFTMPVVGAT